MPMRPATAATSASDSGTSVTKTRPVSHRSPNAAQKASSSCSQSAYDTRQRPAASSDAYVALSQSVRSTGSRCGVRTPPSRSQPRTSSAGHVDVWFAALLPPSLSFPQTTASEPSAVTPALSTVGLSGREAVEKFFWPESGSTQRGQAHASRNHSVDRWSGSAPSPKLSDSAPPSTLTTADSSFAPLPLVG